MVLYLKLTCIKRTLMEKLNLPFKKKTKNYTKSFFHSVRMYNTHNTKTFKVHLPTNRTLKCTKCILVHVNVNSNHNKSYGTVSF